MYDLEFDDVAMNTWAMLRQAWTAVNKVAEARLAKAGLTPEKAAVLWACRDYPGTITPAEIARLTFRENQTIAGLLNRMEKDGLVKRIPKRKGHPFTEIKLTTRGEEACGPGVEIYKKLIQGLVSDLPKGEQEQLQKLLRGLRDKMLDELHLETKKPSGYDSDKPISPPW
jgi:MarR family transcriptional regulator for hemolysin